MLRQLQEDGARSPKPNSDLYEKRMREFENVSKEREKKIIDLREENRRLEEKLTEAGLQGKGDTEKIRKYLEQEVKEWETKCEEL